jgi:hypothetical protein
MCKGSPLRFPKEVLEQQTKSLDGTTMPNGQKYEDCSRVTGRMERTAAVLLEGPHQASEKADKRKFVEHLTGEVRGIGLPRTL